jgi:4-amino-4-deoxy-L-arabinose transferase-like glycosyltransferase
LLLLCMAVYLPGLTTIPVIDRDEARFAQASRQMLESGDWVIPRVQDRPRLNKPPLIYWLQASAAWVLTGGDASRDAIWMYRVPSVLAAIGTVFVTWLLAWRISGPSVAFLAASLLAVCPLVAFDAHQARADQVLLFCTTSAMGSLWVCWHARHRGRTPAWGWVLAFWVSLAAGIMTKGPITPLVAGLCVLSLCLVGRSWRWVWSLKPLVGVVIVLAAVGPWVWAVASRFGFGEYARLVWGETMGRAGGSSEGHWGPPGMHAVILIALFWPGSLTTARAVREAFIDGWPVRSVADLVKPWWRRIWLRRVGRPADAFLLAWALPSWAFFEIFGAKLAHYPMPLYPAVAILSARAAVSLTSKKIAPGTLDRMIWVVVGLAFSLAAMLMGANDIFASPSHWVRGLISCGLGGFALGLVVLTLCVRTLRYDTILRYGRWAMLCVSIAVFTAGSALIPGEESERIMSVLRTVPDWQTRPIASTHRQDSMVFHTRGRVTRLEAAGLAAWRRAHPDGIVVLRVDELAGVPAAGEVLRVLAGPNLELPAPGREWLIVSPHRLPPGPERGRMPHE